MTKISLNQILTKVGEKSFVDLVRETCYQYEISSFGEFMFDLKLHFLNSIDQNKRNQWETWQSEHCPAPCHLVEEGERDCGTCFLLDGYINKVITSQNVDRWRADISSRIPGLVFPKKKKNTPINEEVQFQ